VWPVIASAEAPVQPTSSTLADSKVTGSETASAGSTSAPDVLAEVVVTAQRRSEGIQRVPISMQALGEKTLEEHQVQSFDDYAKLLPSVSFGTLGPGRSDLYFRGITTGFSYSSFSVLPTAGVYIDETPVMATSRTLDLHVYDMARVEALSGPQGTLFGASSLAGTLRLITNKPNPSKFEAGYDLEANKFGHGGGPGGTVEGFVNLPLSDKIALRLVGYYDHAGGYISNTPGSITYTLGLNDPATTLTVNNAPYVKHNFNTADEEGARLMLGVNLDDNWTITPALMFQDQRADGNFLYDPRLPGRQVHDFAPEVNHDDWYLASLTVQGKISDFDLVYSAGYLDHSVHELQDYTYYTVAYDNAPYYSNFPNGKGGYLNPSQRVDQSLKYTKQSHELRVSTPADSIVKVTSGFFFQIQELHTLDNYFVPGAGDSGNPLVVYGDDVFFAKAVAVNKDYGLYTQASYDILPGLTLTAGVRGFVALSSDNGFSGATFGALNAGCTVPLTSSTSCTNVQENLKETGETHKVNLAWQIDPSRMAYVTYSTGFRPGGGNSYPGVKPYLADTVDNYEVGFKSTWLENTLRANVAAYHEKWKGLQYGLQVLGTNGIGGIYNAGAARVNGAEADLQWVVSHLTLSASGAYNDGRLTTDFCDLDASRNPLPSCSTPADTAAPKGTRLPSQPELKATMTARYNVDIAGHESFVQATALHQSGAHTYLSVQQDQLIGDTPGFTSYDFSLGSKVHGVSVEAFIENAFDSHGQLARNSVCNILICPTAARVYPIKPQQFGIRVSQRF
jgi:outer membrane receptor protein involved in Fe transport